MDHTSISPKQLKHFFMYRKTGANGCIEWAGAPNKDGYGNVRVAGRTWLTHRLAWVLANGGPIPEGVFVCHRCDNPMCIKVDHLFLGTCADNNADMRAKGRGRYSEGPAHYKSRLTDDDVRCVRDQIRLGASCAELAAVYQVSPQTIRNIQRGRTYRSVA